MTKTIVLTGGHAATAALATVEELEKMKNPAWNIVWIGVKHAIEGSSVLTLEQKILGSRVKSYQIISGRFQRKWTRHTIPSLVKVPVGFVQAFLVLLKAKPDVVLSFGGFAALPVVVSSWLLGKPVIIHEQTIAIGLANKLSIPFSTKIALAREKSKEYYPVNKVVITGNPIHEGIRRVKPKKTLSKPPVLYITGGSRGSQRMNSAIKSALPQLLSLCKVIHQTGDIDRNDFLDYRSKLDSKSKKNYEIFGTIDPTLVGSIFERADIIISRAGANTVAEIIATGRPAVLIPIPWTRYDEQTKNAQLAKEVGIAIVLTEKELTSAALLKAIKQLLTNWKQMIQVHDSSIEKLDRSAAKNLAALALSLA